MSIDMNKPDTGDTTTMTPVTAVPYQIPRVNLLPPEIEEARQFRTTKFVLGGAVLGVVGLLAGGYLWAALDANKAADELAAEQATNTELQTEKKKYSAVTEIRQEVDAARDARARAMATDVLWAQQLDQIVTEAPADIRFTALTMRFDGADGGSSTPDPLSDPAGVGTITVEAHAHPATHVKTAEWLEAIEKHPGFVDPYYASTELDGTDSVLMSKYVSTVRFTPDIYSGRHLPGGSEAAENGKVD